MKRNELNYLSAYRFLSTYVRNFKVSFFCFALGCMIDMLISVIVPIIIGVWIDEIVYYHDIKSYIRIGILIAFLQVFSCALCFFTYAHQQKLMSWFTYEIKMDVFKRWQNADANYLNSASPGNVISLLQDYANESLHFLIRNGVHFVNGILKMIFIMVILMHNNWQIGLYVLIAVLVSSYITIKLGKHSKQCGLKQREVYGSYIGWLCEMISSLCDIRIIGAKDKVEKEFAKRNNDIFESNITTEVSKLNCKTIIEFINQTVKLVIFVFIGLMASNYNITMGGVLLILSYYSMFADQIKQIGNTYVDGNRRIAYIQSIKSFLNTPTENGRSDMQSLNITGGEIEIKRLFFSYESKAYAINDLSLTINAGEKIAIVGENGSGKTTLMYVILGLYNPERGTIRIDGTNLSDCTLTSIRSQIGLVSQDIYIFNGTIRENILIGNTAAKLNDIIDACVKAEIWDTIKSLPNGLETLIGVNGINLSGGQKQRIAIARIYLKDPRIVIFDEATSAIDDETENSIMNEWEKALANRTSIIISHRFKSIMRCDSVAVMKNGGIIEHGPIDEMIQSTHLKKVFQGQDISNGRT